MPSAQALVQPQQGVLQSPQTRALVLEIGAAWFKTTLCKKQRQQGLKMQWEGITWTC